MCGVAGIMNFSGGQSRQLGAVYAMTQQMVHRGPDDEGYVQVPPSGDCIPLFGGDTPDAVKLVCSERYFPKRHIKTSLGLPSIVVLGHRRLAIQDLSYLGHQPMSSADGRFWIVFNGEIYNWGDVASDLTKQGITLVSRSDTEVLLKAYIQWGENFLSRLNGDFAFAVWDNVEKLLFCARDRMGIKPLYYTFQNDSFIFASDIKAIIASGYYVPEQDPEGLVLSMAFGMAPRPLTAFKGISALAQGHWMKVYASGKTVMRQYWQLPIGTTDPSMELSDAVEQLDDQLTDAVRLRLTADVPVATFMSGGIDSTTISVMASKLHPGIKAFTMGFREADQHLDETTQASATARGATLDHIVHYINPEETLVDMDRWIAGYEEPYYDLAANDVLAKEVSRFGVTVVLNGLGADELFAGYGYYSRISPWQRFRPFRTLPNFVSRYSKKAQRYASVLSQPTADRLHTALFMKFSSTDLQSMFPWMQWENFDVVERVHELYVGKIKFGSAFDAFSYMDLMNYLGNHHVHRLDQFTMAHSLEGRFPYLDHRVVELAFRVPERLKLWRGKHKYVLRTLSGRYIAPESVSMPKKGFGLPLESWLQGPLKSTMNSGLEDLAKRGTVPLATIRRFQEEYRAGLRPGSQLWHLVSLELWTKRFIDNVPDFAKKSATHL